ncbi:MAG: hypothetical protein PHV63_04265 [Candidatus Daviesbacteria bacterium]|nr:hypothetical protein [Candidatus Daviesbacteria bacterium]
MPRIMGITIPAGLEIYYNKTLKMYDFSFFCSIGKNPRFMTRDRYYTLKEISYLFTISKSWGEFTQPQKQAWLDAGNVPGMNGYNLFVQDQAYRIKNLLGGFATPSLFHQYLVGHINLAGSATAVILRQTKNQKPTFPLIFQLSRKSNLASAGGNPYAKLILQINRYYGGQNITDENVIDIPLVSGWATQTLSVPLPLGVPANWELSLELNDVSGDLWFDNVWVTYNGVINNNDPDCDEVNLSWEQVLMPVGSTVESVYPLGGAL